MITNPVAKCQGKKDTSEDCRIGKNMFCVCEYSSLAASCSVSMAFSETKMGIWALLMLTGNIEIIRNNRSWAG